MGKFCFSRYDIRPISKCIVFFIFILLGTHEITTDVVNEYNKFSVTETVIIQSLLDITWNERYGQCVAENAPVILSLLFNSGSMANLTWNYGNTAPLTEYYGNTNKYNLY